MVCDGGSVNIKESRIARDPRPVFAGLLGTYFVLGWVLWGINRSPFQAGMTLAVAMLAELILNRYVRSGKWSFPWSGLITGLGLCLLLNYGANPWLPVLPAVLAIASKSLFVVRDRHFFNPGLFGLLTGMWLSGGMLSPAPAYQWGGSAALVFVVLATVLVFAYPQLRAKRLVGFFLILYLGQAAARAWIMRHHIPAEAVFLGSVTSPAFFLFTFYMLTDPKTTPRDAGGQFVFALAVVTLDLVLHFRQSYSTLFPALFLVQGSLYGFHLLREMNLKSQWLRLATAGVAGFLIAGIMRTGDAADAETSVRFEKRDAGLDAPMSALLEEVDPKVAHVAKWILSVGDAVAVADVDGDGWQDVFLTYPLKTSASRAALFRNNGGLSFERVPLPAMEIFADPVAGGLPSFAAFADVDNDGDLDLFAGNAMRPFLAGYEKETPLNPFLLPKPEYEGDRRMLAFMHSSWHNAVNGGVNDFYRNRGDGTFEKLSPEHTGMKETHWSLAANVADFDGDGLMDLYVASDFGPDDCYRNLGGCRFERVSGKITGSLGRDTYKGMNASIGDFDRDGSPDVYVSNVHAPLQAEGSLLWMNDSEPGRIAFHNEATKRRALNPHRFGWGAAVGDLDMDGWPDIVQCNGMVDDAVDRRFDEPKDYWYANARLARTGPEIHTYADQWADLRGYSIWGMQRTRVLMNREGRFEDAAETCGLGQLGNARGAALADFDNDGDLDLIMTHQFSAVDFYENVSQQKNGWIGIELVGSGAGISRAGF